MPNWTRSDLRQRLLDHGHHYLSADFANGIVQEAIEEFTNEHDWGWREVETETTAGMVIENLGPVRQVLGPEGLPLTPRSKAELRDAYGTLSGTGTPRWYYVEADNSIGVYPSYTGTITVVHDSRACWVDANGENPALEAAGEDWKPRCFPEQQDLIVLLSRARAKSEAQDHDEAGAIRAEYAVRLEEERSKRRQVDELRRIRVTNPEWA